MPTPKTIRPRPPNKTASRPSPAPQTDLVTSHRWAWYGLSVFIPLLGVFLGLFLYDQDSKEVRRVGRNALFISFLIWILFPLVILTGLLLVGVVTLAELFSQAFSGGN